MGAKPAASATKPTVSATKTTPNPDVTPNTSSSKRPVVPNQQAAPSTGYSSNNPFASDIFQDKMPSGPVSLCTFPSDVSRPESGGLTPPATAASMSTTPTTSAATATIPFSQGHRRNASDTQAFHNMVHGSDNNPFLNNCTGEFSSIQARTAGWNPFEDQVSFGSMSEDNIFGAEFDRMRNGNFPTGGSWGPDGGYGCVSTQAGVSGIPTTTTTTTTTSAPTAQRIDPFGSAPFALQGGNV